MLRGRETCSGCERRRAVVKKKDECIGFDMIVSHQSGNAQEKVKYRTGALGHGQGSRYDIWESTPYM